MAQSPISEVCNKKPNALVISPTFFDYYKNIVDEFKWLGFETCWMNTWLFGNPVYKILLRLAPGLVSRLSTARYIRNIELLGVDFFSEILVVKGEGLSVDFVKYLRRRFPSANLSLYLWDAVDNTRGAVKIAPFFHSVSTFDQRDAKLFNWRYRPLFARNVADTSAESIELPVYDWVFIGSLHSDRFAVLKRLVNIRLNQSFFAYGFIPGGLMWLLRHLTNFKLWSRGGIKVSTRSMPSEQVDRVVKSSRAVVDIEHPKQRGLTMRSIETLLMGRKLITTNVEIKNSDLFHESRVCVIDRYNPNISQSFLDGEFLVIPSNIKERYHMKAWLKDVIRS